MKPTIGRIVHFRPTEAVTLAAIITFVHSDTRVNLTAFDCFGRTHNQVEVPLVAPGEPKPEFSQFCEWMPHQVERAAAPEPWCSQTAAPAPATAEPGVTFTLNKPTVDALERIIQKIDEKILAED